MVVRALFVLRRTHTHKPLTRRRRTKRPNDDDAYGCGGDFIFSFPTDAREEFSLLRHASRESRIRRQDQKM